MEMLKRDVAYAFGRRAGNAATLSHAEVDFTRELSTRATSTHQILNWDFQGDFRGSIWSMSLHYNGDFLQ